MEDKILTNEMAKKEFARLTNELIKLGYCQNKVLESINTHLKYILDNHKNGVEFDFIPTTAGAYKFLENEDCDETYIDKIRKTAKELGLDVIEQNGMVYTYDRKTASAKLLYDYDDMKRIIGNAFTINKEG